MKTRKFEKFFHTLLDVKSELTSIKGLVKIAIDDSTRNNRSLSVNQVLRYLRSKPQSRRSIRLANKIERVYTVLKSEVINDRKRSTKRTDAIELNELIATYRATVMDDGKKRRTIGRVVG